MRTLQCFTLIAFFLLLPIGCGKAPVAPSKLDFSMQLDNVLIEGVAAKAEYVETEKERIDTAILLAE